MIDDSPMQLAAWFKQRNADGSRRRKGDLARALDRCAATVTGYCNGHRLPPPAAIAAIAAYTAGDVGPADWPAARPCP